MLKPDRFACSQKIRLKQDPPVLVNQIPTLLPQHILIKTVSQVAIPLKTLAIISTTFQVIHVLNCPYSFSDPSLVHKLQETVFIMPVLKVFGEK